MRLKVEVTIVELIEMNKSHVTDLFSYKKTVESSVLTLEMSVDSKLDLIDAISSVARSSELNIHDREISSIKSLKEE